MAGDERPAHDRAEEEAGLDGEDEEQQREPGGVDADLAPGGAARPRRRRAELAAMAPPDAPHDPGGGEERERRRGVPVRRRPDERSQRVHHRRHEGVGDQDGGRVDAERLAAPLMGDHRHQEGHGPGADAELAGAVQHAERQEPPKRMDVSAIAVSE